MPGRTIITGASGSIGAAVTRALAERGEAVVMACRNPEKARSVRERILAEFPAADLEIRPLDLSSLDSVRSFAASFDGERISSLFNNAGAINREYVLTGDGLEKTFAVNYFAPVLLTLLLLSRMDPDARIVNMVSLTCHFVSLTGSALRPAPEEFSQLGTYARSKLALLHFSLELARRRPDLRINVADPGIVNSNMISMGRWFDPLADHLFRPFCKSPEMGAVPALAALSSAGRNRYFVGKRCLEMPRRYVDPVKDRQLFEETLRILQQPF